MKDAKACFEDSAEQKKQQKGFISFTAPHHKYEYQVDLFCVNDIPNQR